MSRTNQNFSFYRGESRTVFIRVNDSDGSPMNLAGCGIRWWLAKSPFCIRDGDVLIDKALGYGITVVAGGVNVELSDEDTWQTPDAYYHELKVFLPNGGVAMTCTGTAVIRAAADMRTRPEIAATAATVSGSGTVT